MPTASGAYRELSGKFAEWWLSMATIRAWLRCEGLFALSLLGTVVLSLQLARALTGISPLWLPIAIFTAALIRKGPSNRSTMIVGLSAILAGYVVMAAPLADAIVQTLMNGLGAWLVALGLKRVRDDLPWYMSGRQIGQFFIFSLTVSLVLATLGASWKFASRGMPFLHVWPEWYVSNALGFLIGTPLLLSWTEPALKRLVDLRYVCEMGVLTILVAVMSYFACISAYPLSFLVFPILALATVRGGLLGATTSLLAFAAVAVWSVVTGIGPIATLTHVAPFAKMLIFRAYLLTGVLSTLPIAVVLTLRDTMAERLRRQDVISSAALDNMAQGLCMFGSDHRLVTCNRRYAELYELPDHLLVPGTPGLEIVQYQLDQGFDPTKNRHYSNDLLADVATVRSQSELQLPDGRIVKIERRSLPDGGWVSTHQDVTESRNAAHRITYLANHDSLTDLPNRTYFGDHLERCVAHAERGQPFALHCFDLDRFKAVNDTLGHSAGDELLRQVSERIRQTVRNGDVAARLGGDEFAIVQFPLASPEEATALADRIVDVLGQPYDLNGSEAVIGASVGIVLAPLNGINAAELLQRGDLALYRAKAEGRNGFRFFETGMDTALHLRRVMETELRAAVQKGEFELYYQPIMNIETGAISSFEALLRWNHPVRGIVEPSEFIPLAEETGLIVPMGEWVIRHACREAATWPSNIKVAVNLSPLQFKSRDLAALIIGALAAARLAPERLEVEITESIMLLNSEDVLTTLNQLREVGISIAIDDFGTGYSSLSYLRSFPFDKIKIDRSFVRDMASKDDCMAIVHATAELSSKLGMRTTAEGVENVEQLELLRSEGCTEVQGYYISHPLRAEQLERVLGCFPRHMIVELPIVELAAKTLLKRADRASAA